MSLIKIYLKFLKSTPTYFGHSTIIREFFSSSLKSLNTHNTVSIKNIFIQNSIIICTQNSNITIKFNNDSINFGKVYKNIFRVTDMLPHRQFLI